MVKAREKAKEKRESECGMDSYLKFLGFMMRFSGIGKT
jgi:hypothetical protein